MTHNYEIIVGGSKYEGELEMGGSGAIGYKQTSEIKFSGRIEQIFKAALDQIGDLYENVDDFEKFEITKK